MKTAETHTEKARFDTRLSKEQKVIFERAALLGGYRNLSDFVISAVQEKAKMIIQETETVLASQKDSEIFFDAIINAAKPNDKLIAAAKQYNNLLSK
ncbi:MAG: DUF1778 domain-containing protein [Bacteroidota bacterium]|jgi:uncharacterized protein (DUF1778 family)|nr:DUF1778 domain-containing protein [Bacteroidota bacterium]